MPGQTPEQIAALLAPAAALAEQGFLAMGNSLEEAVEIIDRLTRRFAAYVAELTEGTLSETSRGLAEASARVATLARSHRSDIETLGSLAGIVTTIHLRLDALQPRTREIAALSLSARVIAGGMGATGADFLAFSANISVAADRVRDSLENLRGGLGLVDQDLRAAHADAAAFARRHAEAMRAIPERLAANVRSLTVQQGLAADAAVAAHRRSEDVRLQISNQIAALQLGDTIRQRVENVQAAGRLIAALPPPAATSDARGMTRDVAGRVLAAQLTDAAETLAEEGERIETRLTQLALAAHDTGQLGARLHGKAGGEHGGFVATLEADIRRTAAPLAEMLTADAATDLHMVAVMNATEQLAGQLGTLRIIEEDIRIMGLNATLKCGRLGKVGLPLAAVAQELRVCGSRFAADAAEALNELGKLRTIAALLCDPERKVRHASLANAMDGMHAALHRLGELESGMVASSGRLQEDADAVGRLVEVALSQFSVRHGLTATLAQAADAFQVWAAAMASEPEDAGDVMDRIAMIYTMARERDVHARFVPLPGSAQQADSVSAGAVGSEAVADDPADLLDVLF